MPPPNTSISGNTIWFATQQSGRLGLSPVEVQKRAHQRLAERIDLAKTRHKPLSILRQEARRIVDQYYEYEQPSLPKPDREKLVEEILAESYGFSPLEELFRDDTNKEIMVLAYNQVISKKGENWLPTSTRFRDPQQYRNYLNRIGEIGEAYAAPTSSGLDVKLTNGFRALAILPPSILEQPPLVVFTRVEAPKPSGSTVIISENRPVPSPRSSGITADTPRPGAGSAPFSASTIRQIAAQESVGITSRIGNPLPRTVESDPFGKVKQRVTERIVSTCAAAGVYDLGHIPIVELQRVVQAHIQEVVASERLSPDASTLDRLSVEILAAMNR